MQYPICIEWGDDFTATGIQIPDIPGAVTAGDSFEEAYNAAVEIAIPDARSFNAPFMDHL